MPRYWVENLNNDRKIKLNGNEYDRIPLYTSETFKNFIDFLYKNVIGYFILRYKDNLDMNQINLRNFSFSSINFDTLLFTISSNE